MPTNQKNTSSLFCFCCMFDPASRPHAFRLASFFYVCCCCFFCFFCSSFLHHRETKKYSFAGSTGTKTIVFPSYFLYCIFLLIFPILNDHKCFCFSASCLQFWVNCCQDGSKNPARNAPPQRRQPFGGRKKTKIFQISVFPHVWLLDARISWF